MNFRGTRTGQGLAVAALAIAAVGLGAAKPASPPDLTGIWMAPIGVHDIGVPLQGGVTQWKPLSAGDPRKEHIPTLEEARKRGDAMAAILAKGVINIPGQAPGGAAPPPFLTPDGAKAMGKFDPKLWQDQDLNCYPFNVFSRLGGGLGPLQIVQNPKAIMMATAINGDNYPRVIYLDGRSDANALPSWEGFSVGRWVGAVLHVETTKIKGGYFNMSWPFGEHGRLIEDYRVVGAGKARKLEILQKVVDPENYKEPVVRVSYLDWRPDELVQDYPCEEGKGDQAEVKTSPK